MCCAQTGEPRYFLYVLLVPFERLAPFCSRNRATIGVTQVYDSSFTMNREHVYLRRCTNVRLEFQYIQGNRLSSSEWLNFQYVGSMYTCGVGQVSDLSFNTYREHVYRNYSVQNNAWPTRHSVFLSSSHLPPADSRVGALWQLINHCENPT